MLLDFLNLVPERFSIPESLRRVLRKKDLCADNASFVRVIRAVAVILAM